MDHPESDIDPGPCGLRRLGDAMFPIVLGLALHEQEAAVGEVEGDQAALIFIASQLKSPGGAETSGADHGIAAEFLFIIPVPAHAVLAIAI